MSIRTLLVSAGLLVIVCGGAKSQPPLPTPPGVAPSSFPAPDVPLLPKTPPSPPPPPEKSVDDLLTDLERLRSQKSDLEKKEQELTATLRKKLQLQTERLQKLGVMPKEVGRGEPDRVGRILLEGNAKNDEKRILDALGFLPGQILQYPKIEDARMKLEKAGFAGATVEVVPNELDSFFKDIRVRIAKPDR